MKVQTIQRKSRIAIYVGGVTDSGSDTDYSVRVAAETEGRSDTDYSVGTPAETEAASAADAALRQAWAARAEELAERLNIPVITRPENGRASGVQTEKARERNAAGCQADTPLSGDAPDTKYDLYLRIDGSGLSLEADGQSMRGDFEKMLPRLKQSNLEQELLVKAVRIKGMTDTLHVVDATAGMGEDSLILAAAGFDVTMYEYNPIIGALLEDSLRRAQMIPELAPVVARMHLTVGDSLELLPQLRRSQGASSGTSSDIPSAASSGTPSSASSGTEKDNLAVPGLTETEKTAEAEKASGIENGFRPDVVLLDPMFPARQKSALVKKKFQLLHHLEQPCGDEADLLQAAIAAGPRRIVIKRPPKGPYLAGMKPSYSLSGKAVRYDCMVFARQNWG